MINNHNAQLKGNKSEKKKQHIICEHPFSSGIFNHLSCDILHSVMYDVLFIYIFSIG